MDNSGYFVKVHFEKAIPEIAFDFRIIPSVSVLFPDQYGIKPALNSSAKKGEKKSSANQTARSEAGTTGLSWHCSAFYFHCRIRRIIC